jgi:integrase/recombinase XerD
MRTIHERLELDLKLGGYSPHTCRIYLLYARLFAKYFKRSPEEMGADEIREYLLYVIERRRASRSTVRQIRAALSFLYAITLQRPVEVEHIPVMRRQRRLPQVLSGTEVEALFHAVASPKYRAILMAQYGGGLRIGEACRLQVEDIDSKRMLIRVRAGKGGKDRYTILSARLLHELRAYWAISRPHPWLFPGNTEAGHASPDSARLVFRQVLAASGITKKVTPHVLRHCFATHLLETGKDINFVKIVLGHGSLRATEVYAHVSLQHISRTTSPLDLLGTPSAAVLG